jgi:hypothetical protein
MASSASSANREYVTLNTELSKQQHRQRSIAVSRSNSTILSPFPTGRQSLITKSSLPERDSKTNIFARLLPELMSKVLRHSLSIRHDTSPPPVLLALGTSKDKGWYNWAHKEYFVINANITWRNEESLNRMSRRNRMRLRHIKLTLPLCFRAQLLTVRNNLETIVIDATNYSSGTMKISPCTIIRWLVEASTAAHTVVVKTRRDRDDDLFPERLWEMDMPFAKIVKGLGFMAKEEEAGSNYRLFIWESTNLLRWAGI